MTAPIGDICIPVTFFAFSRDMTMYDDLPIPKPVTKLPSSKSVAELPIPKLMGEGTEGGSDAPVPLPLEQLMELAVATAQILPVPQPIEQLTNKP